MNLYVFKYNNYYNRIVKKENTLQDYGEPVYSLANVLNFNFGDGVNTTQTLNTNAKGDYVAVMDADMQDPPSLLPQMLELLRSGEYDSVATRRVSRQGEPPIRSWFARRFYRIINKMSDSDIVDGARDFRLMKADMVRAIVAMGERNRFSKGIFGWIGFRTYWLPYENVERVAVCILKKLLW